MFFKMNRWKQGAGVAFGLLLLAPHVCLAEPYYDEGVKRFGKKDFQGALAYFTKAVEVAPWDANAMYYQALSMQYLKNWKGASEIYRNLADRFPTTQAGINAVAVLQRLDPNYFRNKMAAANAIGSAGGAGGVSDVDSKGPQVEVTSPAQCRIPVTHSGDANLIDGSINGKSLKFEYSGPETVLSVKDAAAIGIKGTIGSKVLTTARVGDINERNYQVTIDNVDRPRLGDDFFKQFTVATEANYLSVVKKSGGVARAGWDVPFKRKGKDMLVDATVNGRRVSMIFEQGGESVIPKSRLREFGLEADESSSINMFNASTNPTGAIRGEAGFGETKVQTVAQAKLQIGPVNASSVQFKVDENAKEAKLSASAFGEWKYDVDLASNLLRFHR